MTVPWSLMKLILLHLCCEEMAFIETFLSYRVAGLDVTSNRASSAMARRRAVLCLHPASGWVRKGLAECVSVRGKQWGWKHFEKMNAWVMFSTCRMPSTSALCSAGRGRYTYLACLQPSGQKHRHTNTHCTDELQEPHGVYSGWQNLRRSVGFSLKQDLKNHALILGATRYKLRPMESSMAWVWWQPPRPAAELEIKKHRVKTRQISSVSPVLDSWPDQCSGFWVSDSLTEKMIFFQGTGRKSYWKDGKQGPQLDTVSQMPQRWTGAWLHLLRFVNWVNTN